MATPDERKTIQVSPAVHEAVYELATRLGTSANGALAYLLDESTIRVQVSKRQCERWTAAAAKDGLSLPNWVSHCVEAAMGHSPERNSRTLEQIFYRVDLLCQNAGLKKPTMGPPPKEK